MFSCFLLQLQWKTSFQGLRVPARTIVQRKTKRINGAQRIQKSHFHCSTPRFASTEEEPSLGPEAINNALVKLITSAKPKGQEYSDYTEALTDLCAHFPRGAFGHGWEITKEGIKRRKIVDYVIANAENELDESKFNFDLETLEHYQSFDSPSALQFAKQQQKRMDKLYPNWRQVLEPESVAHPASSAVHVDGTSIILMDHPSASYLNSINAAGGRRLIIIHWHKAIMMLRELRHFVRPWWTTVTADTYIDDVFIIPDNNILQIQNYDLPLSTLNALKKVHYPHLYLHSDIQEFFTPQLGPFFRRKTTTTTSEI